MKGLQERVADDEHLCACDGRDGLPNDSEKSGILQKGGDSVLFCRLLGKNEVRCSVKCSALKTAAISEFRDERERL